MPLERAGLPIQGKFVRSRLIYRYLIDLLKFIKSFCCAKLKPAFIKIKAAGLPIQSRFVFRHLIYKYLIKLLKII
ncbi:hypothetical protein GCM10027566_01400 [Arachidicoccus ginsenosidivorans]